MRLRRADCSTAGITRVARGRGFSYADPAGKRVTDAATLARIRELTIPPAWAQVWICLDPHGHLQATGNDAAGRKQYLYHPAWREQRDRGKFRRMEDFGRALPRLRRRVSTAFATGDEPTYERVGACAARLLDVGMFRVGSEQYADPDGGYGLATLTREHLTWRDGAAVFDYLAKGGVERRHSVRDPEAVSFLRALTRRRSGPPELLVYRDGRHWHRLGSDDINAYIKAATAEQFSAKDFRTWNATVLAAVDLAAGEREQSRRGRERAVNATLRRVAEQLGNTPAVARRAYVDPRVFDRFRSGWTIDPRPADMTLPHELSERRRRRLELAVLDLLS